MKNLIIIIVAILSSCDSRPVLNSKKYPFIVQEIKQVANWNEMVEYIGPLEAGYDLGRPSIILPVGLYNINDTIKIVK